MGYMNKMNLAFSKARKYAALWHDAVGLNLAFGKFQTGVYQTNKKLVKTTLENVLTFIDDKIISFYPVPGGPWGGW